MSKPKLLDLFCKAGGAGVGYFRAGYEVTGVDIESQPRYPFRFFQADALEYLTQHGHKYDLIHASPPCQAYSILRSVCGDKEYPELIQATRKALLQTGKPYIIENVPGARSHLLNPVMLCGTHFGLKVYRHRLFECNPWLMSLPHFPHNDQTPKANRPGGLEKNISPKGFITVCGGKNTGRKDVFDYRCLAMGIDWMNRTELHQAIPPAYTEWLGRQMMSVLFQESTTKQLLSTVNR